MLIRENNLFGEIELFRKNKTRTHNVICISDIAEVLVLRYDYFMMFSPREMISEVEREVNAKCKVMSVKYSEDCESKDSQKRDKEKYASSIIKGRSLSTSKAQSSNQMIERNPTYKQISTKNHFFMPRRTLIQFPRIPKLLSEKNADKNEVMKKSISEIYAENR